MSSLRILQVLSCDRIGGTEMMAGSVFPRIAADEFQVEVAFPGMPGPVGADLRKHGLTVHYIEALTFRNLFHLTRSKHYDIVSLYGFRANLFGRLAFLVGSPSTLRIQNVRGLYVFDKPSSPWVVVALRFVERGLSMITDMYIANSQGAIDNLVSMGIPPAKCMHVPNGIDIDRWPVGPESGPRQIPTIVCVGRFVEHKRQSDLVRALAQLRANGLEFCCNFIGSGPTEAAVSSLAIGLGIDSHVRFLGELPPASVARRLQEADVFVLVSQSEGMPRSLMEAMAAGLPAVATAVNGTTDLLIDGQTGSLVPVGDIEALAAATGRLLLDPGLRQAMGAVARRQVRECFSIDDNCRGLESCYRRAVEMRPRLRQSGRGPICKSESLS